jgi:hypothetical protein
VKNQRVLYIIGLKNVIVAVRKIYPDNVGYVFRTACIVLGIASPLEGQNSVISGWPNKQTNKQSNLLTK